MAYSDLVLVDKLKKLSDTTDSISLLSHWMIFHRRHCGSSVKTWDSELRKTTSNRKLIYLYLCNDVLQNSRKKGPEFLNSFSSVLPGAMEHAFRRSPNEIRKKIERMLGIWEERGLYSKSFLEGIRKSFPIQASAEPTSPVVERPAVIPHIDKLAELITLLAGMTEDPSIDSAWRAFESSGEPVFADLLPRLETYRSILSARISTREQALGVLKALTTHHEKLVKNDREQDEVVQERIKRVKIALPKNLEESPSILGSDGDSPMETESEIEESGELKKTSPPRPLGSTSTPKLRGKTTSEYNTAHPLPTPRPIRTTLRKLSLSLSSPSGSSPSTSLPRKLSIPSMVLDEKEEEDEGVHMGGVTVDV